MWVILVWRVHADKYWLFFSLKRALSLHRTKHAARVVVRHNYTKIHRNWTELLWTRLKGREIEGWAMFGFGFAQHWTPRWESAESDVNEVSKWTSDFPARENLRLYVGMRRKTCLPEKVTRCALAWRELSMSFDSIELRVWKSIHNPWFRRLNY